MGEEGGQIRARVKGEGMAVKRIGRLKGRGKAKGIMLPSFGASRKLNGHEG